MAAIHTRTPALPAVPPALAARGVSLRAEQSADGAFLARLYVSTRWEELQPTGWSDEQKVGFLLQQFTLQTAHYSCYYAAATRGIILLGHQAAGRLYLLQMPGDLRIVDIALLPEFRAQGLGSGLIEAVFAAARVTGSKVSIHVENFNPARRLYERLGFIEVGEHGVYRRMEWQPAVTR